MKKKKGFMAILITAALLFLVQGCYWGYHGHHGDWGEHHYHDGYGHHGDWGGHHYRGGHH